MVRVTPRGPSSASGRHFSYWRGLPVQICAGHTSDVSEPSPQRRPALTEPAWPSAAAEKKMSARCVLRSRPLPRATKPQTHQESKEEDSNDTNGRDRNMPPRRQQSTTSEKSTMATRASPRSHVSSASAARAHGRHGVDELLAPWRRSRGRWGFRGHHARAALERVRGPVASNAP